MSTETNKAAFASMIDAANSGDLELVSATIDELVAPDRAEPFKQVWATLLRAYPDLRLTPEDVVAEGDKLVIRNSITATHRGEFMGVPATGRPVHYDEIFILRFADGRIADAFGVVDVLAQLRQIGAA
jgi:hypothetical protein